MTINDIECIGGRWDGLCIRRREPQSVIVLPGTQCEHFYELFYEQFEVKDPDPGNWRPPRQVYRYARPLRYTDAVQDNWPDPPIDRC